MLEYFLFFDKIIQWSTQNNRICCNTHSKRWHPMHLAQWKMWGVQGMRAREHWHHLEFEKKVRLEHAAISVEHHICIRSLDRPMKSDLFDKLDKRHSLRLDPSMHSIVILVHIVRPSCNKESQWASLIGIACFNKLTIETVLH